MQSYAFDKEELILMMGRRFRTPLNNIEVRDYELYFYF